MSTRPRPADAEAESLPADPQGPPPPGEPFAVVIAGGGVAALEAVLALRQASSVTSIQVICPDHEFTLRQLSVGQPFGSPPTHHLNLADFCRRNDATLLIDRVAEVWGSQRRILLDSAEDVFYDALLLAPGARPYDALPGAHAFRGPGDVDWFGAMLDRLEHGQQRRLTFALPTEVRWSLPLYELAVMTGRMLRHRNVSGVEVDLVTHEKTPLMDLGEAVGKRILGLLGEAGVEVHCGRAPVAFEDDALVLADGGRIDTSEVVCLAGLRVPEIPGIPQGRHGFIPTDAGMRVDGIDRVWAAGDATWFPIKQGGIAAQQADIAAAGISLEAGVQIEVLPLRPVVRATMLTGEEPEFFRAPFATEAQTDEGTFPLWWPPGKVAGKWLAPYLAREWSGAPSDPLVPLEDLSTGDEAKRSEQHRSAIDLALRFADVDAKEDDLRQALRWLDVAEKLNVTLPPEYVTRRADWLEILHNRKK